MLQLATWFEKLYPQVTYPSSRLSGALGQRLKKVTRLHERGVSHAIAAFLETEVDFDFVSTSLSNLGLKRGQLLEKDCNQSGQCEAASCDSVINEVIVDLEKFRSSERLVDKFIPGWVRTLTGITESDKVLKASIKQLTTRYTTLVRNQSSDDTGVLSTFLAAPFRVLQHTQRTSSQKPTTPGTISKQSPEQLLLKALKENSHLREQISSLESYVDVLSQTVKDLSQEKMEHIKQIDENKQL